MSRPSASAFYYVNPALKLASNELYNSRRNLKTKITIQVNFNYVTMTCKMSLLHVKYQLTVAALHVQFVALQI